MAFLLVIATMILKISPPVMNQHRNPRPSAENPEMGTFRVREQDSPNLPQWWEHQYQSLLKLSGSPERGNLSQKNLGLDLGSNSLGLNPRSATYGCETFLCFRFLTYKLGVIALAGIAQWIECRLTNQSINGSIPSQGTCLWARSPAGGVLEATTH